MKTLFTIILIALAIQANSQQTKVKHLTGNTIKVENMSMLIAGFVDTAKITGLQVAVINNSKLAWKGNFGYRVVKEDLKINDSTVMYAASLTKPVIAYLMLRLIDEGIFELDKPLYTYLKNPIAMYPKWKDLAKDTIKFNKVTARMILSHTSGLPILRQLYGDELKFIAEPGQRFYYSNEALNLLGFIIEEHTGKAIEILSRKLIFDPLKMSRTSTIWSKSFNSNYSLGYYGSGEVYGVVKKDSLTSRAAGSMSTTASDYAMFLINMMKRRGLSRTSYAEMLKEQTIIKSKRGFGPLRDTLTTANDAAKLAWGLGMGMITTPYGKAYFHAGHGEANQNFFITFPEQGIAMVLLSNSNNFENTAEKIIRLCIGEVKLPLAWLGYEEKSQ